MATDGTLLGNSKAHQAGNFIMIKPKDKVQIESKEDKREKILKM